MRKICMTIPDEVEGSQAKLNNSGRSRPNCTRAVLSQGGPHDATVNFSTYSKSTPCPGKKRPQYSRHFSVLSELENLAQHYTVVIWR